MRKFYVYIDDERKCPVLDENVAFVPITCKTYNSAVRCILELVAMNQPFVVDFDHDLGEVKTGYDVCKFIVENNISIDGYHIHSMNPTGAANIEQLFSHYGYTKIII